MTQESYSLLLKQAQALISSETDFIANAANLSSFLYHNLDDVNWVGFYLFKQDELVLGPFCGQPACTRIAIGKGVCGTAFAEQRTLMVNDVHSFAGHIACDAASESEVVVPFNTSMYQGVFDIDSPIIGRFGEAEKELFEGVARALEKSQSDS
ncbi:MAG: GAF domain-containing protein [Arenicella sp.]|nr:GAF domain-containing protein [Arenicella sp.]